MYPGTLDHGKPRLTAKATVTAGLMCAPLTPPATYTARVTAKNHPNPMINQSPLASKIFVPRPDWFSAATAIATTPSPNRMSTNVPKNSERYSPQAVARHPVFPRTAPAAAIHSPFGRPGRLRDITRPWPPFASRGRALAKRETRAAGGGTSEVMREPSNGMRGRVGRGADRLKEGASAARERGRQISRCARLDVPWARCRPARVLRETIQRFLLDPIMTYYTRRKVSGRERFE